MLCKICNTHEANPKYSGLCAQCRQERYEYSRGTKCLDCGKLIRNRTVRCYKCYSASLKVKRVCEECGKIYITRRSIRLKYCSQSCRISAMVKSMSKGGKNSPAYKGTNTVEHSGYVYCSGGPHKKRKREHMLIAEHVLGRSMRKGEIVHHINLDKTDNRNLNLIICTQSYHQFLHHAMAKAWVKEHIRAK